MADIRSEDVMKLLNYDPISGVFTWKQKKARGKIGNRAGYVHHSGYRYIGLNGKDTAEAKLAFLIMTGSFPKKEIDHINRKKDDNRWDNLREAHRTENCSNKTYPGSLNFKGVTRYGQKYQAKIGVRGKRMWLGSYETSQKAHTAYCLAAYLYHGEFACTETKL